MDLVVVPISLAHAKSFRECLDVVAREKRFLALTEAPGEDKMQAFVRESVDADAAQFVALDGDVVVAWADIFPSWAHAVAHCGSLGMGVLPEYRGRGLGKRLLLACIAKAQAKGITRIVLQARADNEVAIKLYESVGFKHEAQIQNAMRFDGVYFEAVQMSLCADVSRVA